MKPDSILKHAAKAFLLAVGAYVLFFSCDSYLRHRRGPWEVTFIASTNGSPALLVNHAAYGLTNRLIVFKGEKATNEGTVVFDAPRKTVPFGRTRFEDLTYLPGGLVLDLFGHEVEFLPRAMFINLQEVSWTTPSPIVLDASMKVPGLKDRDRKGRR